MSLSEEFTQQVKNTVQAHLSERGFNLFLLATKLNMSERHLSRNLREMTGTSAGKFIRNIRLDHAKKLLESKSHMTVQEVAKAVGFEKTSYFSQIYAEQFGKRPSEYFNNTKN